MKDFGDVAYEQIDGLMVENMTALGHIAACQKEVNVLDKIYGERRQSRTVMRVKYLCIGLYLSTVQG